MNMSQGDVHTVPVSDATLTGKMEENAESADSGAPLTNRQVELITQTWNIVRKDLEKAGTVMFMK